MSFAAPDILGVDIGDGFTLFRTTYGLLLLVQFIALMPHARRYFLSEKWGGFGHSEWEVNTLQNPVVLPWLLVLWFLCGVCLATGQCLLPAAITNGLFCWYFFVHMRWKSLLRGMGAPGYMTWWLACAVLLLEITRYSDGAIRSLVLIVLQVDFAAIFLVAGLYKLTAGYFINEGMEYGLANPQWGRWWKSISRMSPQFTLFWGINHLAWCGEIVAALLLLIPETRWAGALLLATSFLAIAFHIRLQCLPFMVMLACSIYWLPAYSISNVWTVTMHAPGLPAVMLWLYLTLLPLVYAGLLYNYYGRRRLPRMLQLLLDGYTSVWGIHLWRVFSADHTHFVVRVFQERRRNGSRELLSHWGMVDRWKQVAEAITVTSLFTTLKYYSSRNDIFKERLLRYASTLACPADAVLVFQYSVIKKEGDSFSYMVLREFIVDPCHNTMHERQLQDDIDQHGTLGFSPIYEAAAPGSYAPMRS